MDRSTNSPSNSLIDIENVPHPGRADAAPVQRARQRVVLGTLSENEQHSQSASQGSQFSKHSSISDRSQPTFFGCPSNSSYNVSAGESCEVVLAASGQELSSGSSCLDSEKDAFDNKNFKLLLELDSVSFQDTSMQSDDDSMASEDVLRASEYTEEIYQHLREREMRFRPRPAFLRHHPEITDDMRAVLVDWLAEVGQEYKLHSETLHLAVNYLDRFLSRTKCVERNKLQLVGTAALLTAAKHGEISPPELSDFVYVTDGTYTKEQLLRMEHIFLKVLAFELLAPTSDQFLHLFTSIHKVCAITKNLALYIAELSLLEIDPLLKYAPSIIAAGAYCLANCILNQALWPDPLHAFTGYTMDDIMSCYTDLHHLYVSAETWPQQTIREKYKSSKYCHVSLITPPAVLTSL
ncbi:cyclin-A1 [Brachionichthys hirsutus]|uniref:cyclin-A1 n=1 Tax=Brachionichthys hirsutus TaxID=412623 RepID=UPI003604D21D